MAIQYTSSQLLKKISDNNYSYTSTFNKKIQESDSNVEKLQKEVDVLKNDVRKMKKYSNGIASKTMVEKNLKKFVKSYNSMKKAAGDVTDIGHDGVQQTVDVSRLAELRHSPRLDKVNEIRGAASLIHLRQIVGTGGGHAPHIPSARAERIIGDHAVHNEE